jgi:hypothetical protein
MKDRPNIVNLSKVSERIARWEIAHLEIARSLARKRLAPFEQTYHVTSEQFLAEMTAEDLHGGDDEYVQWAGEYRLLCRLDEQLQQLRGIRYRD